MLIKTDFKSSKLNLILSWLFVDNKKDIFKNSKFIKFLDIFSNNKLAFGCLIISFISLWYEAFFTGIGLGFVERYNFAIIFLFLSFIFCDKKRLVSSKAIIYLLLFEMSLLISCLVASICGLEIGMLINGLLIFSQFVVAFILSSTFKSKRLLINVMLIMSVPMLLVGIFQGLFGQDTSSLWVSTAENLVGKRAYAFFGSPNILGSAAMITVIVSLFSFMEKKKWYYAFYEVVALVALVFTFSRSAWIGLLVGLVVSILIKNWKLIILAPISLIALFIPSIRQRIFVSFSQNYLVDAALDGRIWSANNAVEIFKTSPIIGTGPGSYGGQTAIYYNSPVYLDGMQNGYIALPYTDNQWLQIFVQTGIVGTSLVGLFFVSHFVNNLRQYKKSKSYLSLGIIAATVAIIVNGFFANIWEFGAVSVLAGAYLGLGSNYEK